MSKAVMGAAEIAAGLAVEFVPGAGQVAGYMLLSKSALATSLLLGGASMEAGAIASALAQNRGMGITTRQPAAYRQVVYGEQRVGGIIVYQSTTGSKHDQYNFVIVLAGHEVEAIENLYLDGRQVHWSVGSTGNGTRNGVNFGGTAGGGSFIGPGGQHYNFDGLVYCEARFGDQAAGDVIGGLTANDPNWASSSSGSPYLGGCAYVYLKIEYDAAMFPSLPEIKFTVRGKNDIYDPRTGTTGYSTNWALIVADVITNSEFGLGDTGSVNEDQLIAAANVCDEQLTLAAGGTEARYACHWHYDCGTAPGDVLQTMMNAAVGRISRIGGEWFIYPAYWTGPSLTFDDNALTGKVQWQPYRKMRDLYNRINGTYIAANYPYNVAGNLYDSNGWYDGTIQNNFPFAFQPTNYPQYACDELHGYGTGVDVYLTADGGIPLPGELTQSCVLSVTQAQRCAKIYLMRNRQQGTGTLPMNLQAWQVQPLDVIYMTFAPYNWVNKQLEITGTSFTTEPNTDGIPELRFQVQVQETDPSVYDWSTSEELTVYDVPANPTSGAPYTVDPPTNLAIKDDDSTVLTQSDGTTIPRLLVTWTPPDDTYVANGGAIQVQYQFTTLNTAENGGTPPSEPTGVLTATQQADGSWVTDWIDAGTVSGQSTHLFVNGINPKLYANITAQARSIRSNGAASDWVQTTAHGIGTTVPQQVTGVSVSEAPYKTATSTQSLVAVDFTPAAGDPNFSYVRVYFSGYNGNPNPQLMSTGSVSPIQFLCDTTGDFVTVTVVAVNPNGVEAPFATAPIAYVLLNGVMTAPPAPSIAAVQTALPGATGWQFSFNVIGGLEAEAGLISGYRVYHSESNVTPVPPGNYYTAYPQPSTNVGQIVCVRAKPFFRWVSEGDELGA